MSAPDRCGSYPLMNLAEDASVDYDDLLLVFDAGVAMERGAEYEDVPPGRMATWIAAARRCAAAAPDPGEAFERSLWALAKHTAARRGPWNKETL